MTIADRTGTSASVASCDLSNFTGAIHAATTWLAQNRERINALNVFPVPDGDTGDNMVMTMRGAVEDVDACRCETVAELCEALAEGALRASRGNSGVILSQMLSGFADSLRQSGKISRHSLADAFARAADEGYKAHSAPVEGTMMTVMRDTARAAVERADVDEPMSEFLRHVLEEARASVARTQELLPKLRQAGVVDAGGEGIYVLLEGALKFLSGEAVDQMQAVAETVDLASLEMLEEDAYGYCTNFMVQGEGMDVEAFREKVLSLGRSAIVIGNPNTIKVHVHTLEPGEVLSEALRLGTLHQIKLDNMDDQYRSVLRQCESGTQQIVTTALVAVASGAGLAQLFRQEAGARVVPGGQSMNPSTGDLISAIEKAPSDGVIVLPNNPNVIMAAEKAAKVSSKQVRVLPTRSVPVGLVAALAYDPSAGVDENLDAMQSVIEGVTSIEITQAVRDAVVNGVEVCAGEFIGLVDDELVTSAKDLADTLLEALRRAEASQKELLTLYQGQGVAEVEPVIEAVQREFPNLEVELHQGGQPHYVLVGSLE